MMKKIISLILVVLCFVLLVGCGSNTTSNNSEDQVAVLYSSSNSVANFINEYLEEHPDYHVEMITANQYNFLVIYSK